MPRIVNKVPFRIAVLQVLHLRHVLVRTAVWSAPEQIALVRRVRTAIIWKTEGVTRRVIAQFPLLYTGKR